jgi:hypothetical protein
MTELSDPSDPRIHVRAVRLFGWRAVAAIVAGLTVLVAVAAFLALGFLFIVLPTMVLGAVAYYFLPKRPSRGLGNSNAVERTGNTTIIDANYRVTNDHSEDNRTGHK